MGSLKEYLPVSLLNVLFRYNFNRASFSVNSLVWSSLFIALSAGFATSLVVFSPVFSIHFMIGAVLDKSGIPLDAIFSLASSGVV